MAQLHHPFLIGLVSTYQDDHFVYILLQLIQGGELYNYIHTRKSDFLPDKDAKFYAACVASGLGFMHHRSIVYRDLKPEVRVDISARIGIGFLPSNVSPLFLPSQNVLIDNAGGFIAISFFLIIRQRAQSL